jgi:hypothetical protein
LTVPEKRSNVKSAKKTTIYPACEPKPPLPAPSQFNKAEGKLFSGFNLIFKELETTFFFLQRTKNYFLSQEKKENLYFLVKRNSKFLCHSTNYSSSALLVLLLNLFSQRSRIF